MYYSDPSKLGIVACPGGATFAGSVLKRLSTIYKRRFDRKASALADRYSISKEMATRKINFADDVSSPLLYIPGDVNLYRHPQLKINTRFSMFANGEIKTEFIDSVRGKDLYIFQDVENHHPVKFNDGQAERTLSVNDHIFNTLVTIDAANQAGAERITLVMPVYPYSRQHKKKGREGLTASRVGQMFESMGVSRIITLDIHSREIENSFSKVRLENLHASYQIARRLADLFEISSENMVVVAPDTGAVDRNKFYASAMQIPLALLYKERDYSRVSKDATDSNITDMKLLGTVTGKDVFMADDMLGTGGTLLKAMKFLKEQGAKRVICAVSLPLFSGNAIEDFDKAYEQGNFYRIIGTNAVYQEELMSREWYISVDVTGLFAQIISLLHHGRSLSPMLENRDMISKILHKAKAHHSPKQ